MNGILSRLGLLVGLAFALGAGRTMPAPAQDLLRPRVTTHSRIPIDVVVSDPDSGAPVHFTGSFELLLQVTLGGPDTRPQIEGFFNAASVRGEGEERGSVTCTLKPIGLYRFVGNPNDLPASFSVEAMFPLLHAGPGERLQEGGSLEVSLDVMVGLDGIVMSSVRGIIIHG